MRFYSVFKRTTTGGAGIAAEPLPTAPPGKVGVFNGGNHLACNFTDARGGGWPVHRVAAVYVPDLPDLDSGAITVNVVAAAGTYTRSGGSFLTDGFQVGGTVTWTGFTNAGNNATKVILALSATVMTVANAGLVNETGNGNEQVTGPDYGVPVAADLAIWIDGLGDGQGSWVKVNQATRFLEPRKVTYFDIVAIPNASVYSRDEDPTYGSIDAVLVIKGNTNAPDGDHYFALAPDLTTIGEDVPDIGGPAKRVRAVTPSDTADLPDGACSFVHVIASGDLEFIAAGDSDTAINTWAVTAGQDLQVSVRRVLTGTTATVAAVYH